MSACGFGWQTQRREQSEAHNIWRQLPRVGVFPPSSRPFSAGPCPFHITFPSSLTVPTIGTRTKEPCFLRATRIGAQRPEAACPPGGAGAGHRRPSHSPPTALQYLQADYSLTYHPGGRQVAAYNHLFLLCVRSQPVLTLSLAVLRQFLGILCLLPGGRRCSIQHTLGDG